VHGADINTDKLKTRPLIAIAKQTSSLLC